MEINNRKNVSKNPFKRAEQRIFAAIERGQDPEKAARARMNKCTKPSKLLGLYYVCKDFGYNDLAREVKAKCIQMEAGIF